MTKICCGALHSWEQTLFQAFHGTGGEAERTAREVLQAAPAQTRRIALEAPRQGRGDEDPYGACPQCLGLARIHSGPHGLFGLSSPDPHRFDEGNEGEVPGDRGVVKIIGGTSP